MPFSSPELTILPACGRDRELSKDRGLWGRECSRASSFKKGYARRQFPLQLQELSDKKSSYFESASFG